MIYTGKPSPIIDRDNFEIVRHVYKMYTRHEDYWRPDHHRLIRNRRMAWGVNFGQWPAYTVEKLREEGRRPPTLNHTGKKVESQISAFQSNDFDMKYTPVSGRLDSLSEALQDMFYSDRSNLDWDAAEAVALRDFFTWGGYERMRISDKYNKEFGNIAFEAVDPQHIYLDTSWKSNNPNDIRHYYEWSMHTASEIARMFGDNVSERLKDIRDREEREGVNLGEYHGGVHHYHDSDQKWGDMHRVIWYHYLEDEARDWEYDLVNNCVFPETGFPNGSDKDRQAKTEYIRMMGLDPNHDIRTVRQNKRIKMLQAICPSIDNELVLAKGKDRIQTNNVNLYPLANSLNGQFKGTVDELYDIQRQFNNVEMIKEDVQMRIAKGGFILDRALAGGDVNKEREIEQRWNDPGARIWADEGATEALGQHGGMIPLPQPSIPGDFFHQNNFRLDQFDMLSLMPAAMDSRSESTTESGRLFQSKIQVGMLGQKHQRTIWKWHKKWKAEAYALQAKITYAGMPRMFSKVNGDIFTINDRKTDASGNAYILNDISKLPEMKVNMLESPKGTDIRTELSSKYQEVLPLFSQDPQDRLVKLIVLKGLIETMPITEESKESVEKAIDLLTNNEAMNQAMMNMKLSQQLKQLEGQMQQGAQQGPQGGPQGGPAQGTQGGPPQGPPQQVSMGELSEEEAVEGTTQQPEFLTNQ